MSVPLLRLFYFSGKEKKMKKEELLNSLCRTPVIAAVRENLFAEALRSPAEVIFALKANLNTVAARTKEAHAAGKALFVHLDLCDGIGKDKTGAEYLSGIGVDGIISTRSQLIRSARECGLFAVQRFFAVDSQGLFSITETLGSSNPDLMEIMPGVVTKAIARFAPGAVPVIAGGLLETKKEVTAALEAGALAVSTGRPELWSL